MILKPTDLEDTPKKILEKKASAQWIERYDLSSLSSIVHYTPEDMTVAVEAEDFESKALDLTEFLVEYRPSRLASPPEDARQRMVTYHDACDLAHPPGTAGAGLVDGRRPLRRAAGI